MVRTAFKKNAAPKPTEDDIERYFVAAYEGYSDAVTAFVDKFGEKYIDVKDDYEQTALMNAVQCRSTQDLVTYLIKKGANVNARDGEKDTPLAFAILSENEASVATLLAAGANPELKNTYGKTAIDLAEEDGLDDIVEMLREAKKNRRQQKAAAKKEVAETKATATQTDSQLQQVRQIARKVTLKKRENGI